MRNLAVLAVACLWAGIAQAVEITDAQYDGPTNRYPHAVLGDDIEYDTLTVTLSDGRRLQAQYENTLVFEDVAPRLADVDSDGAPEVITVESHESEGARLVIWGLEDGHLRQIARTPFIGTRFRWLAPAGAGDLDGDGHVEIAFVDRPHLAKTLRIWRYKTVNFEEIAVLPGVTNHRIGEDYITGGLRDCGAGPELILADARWTQLVAVTLGPDGLDLRSLGPFQGRASADRALACE